MNKSELPTAWKPMEVGMVIETGSPHTFQGKPYSVLDYPRCPGNFQITEIKDFLLARGICTTPGCGVTQQIME